MSTATDETTEPGRRRGRKPKETTTLATIPEPDTLPATVPPPLLPVPPAPPDDPTDEPPEEDEDGYDAEGAPIVMASVPAAPTPPTRAPSATATAAAASLVAASTELRARQAEGALRIEDDLDEMLEGVDFGENKHCVKLTRLRTYPPGANGQTRSSPLGTWPRKLSIEEIRDVYGGGEYLYSVWGPHASGKLVCRHKKTFSLEGPSLHNGQPLTPGMAAPAPDGSMALAKDLMAKAIDARERELDRVLSEQKELKTALLESAKRDPAMPLVALMKEMEEKRLAEQRLVADREERRLKEEREMRKEEQTRRDAADKAQKEADAAKLEAEKLRAATESQNLIAMMKNNTDVMLATFKETMTSKEQQSQALIAATQSQAAMQMKMLADNFSQQMSMQQQQTQLMISNMQSLSETKEKMFLGALERSQSERKGGLRETMQEMVQLKQAMAIMSGDNQNGGGVVDTIKDVMASPGFGQVIQAFTGGRQGAAPAAPPNQPTAVGVVQVSRPRVAAGAGGAGAVPAGQRGPSPWPTTTGAPPRPPEEQAAQGKPAPTAQVATTARPKPRPASAPPGVTTAPSVVTVVPTAAETVKPPPDPVAIGVVFPAADAPLWDQYAGFITAIDVALRADWSAQDIMTGIVSRFSPEVHQNLKETGFDGCVAIVEQHAPQSIIITPYGIQVMHDLYDLFEKG